MPNEGLIKSIEGGKTRLSRFNKPASQGPEAGKPGPDICIRFFPIRSGGEEMRIKDKIYGEFVIEGILEALVFSGPVQRLKGIRQGGASYLVNGKWNVTRYEHSVGVMLLIRKLGGSLEEQIAGLLHDVSHTAFSHVVDFVFDNEKEDYHEKIFQRIIADSEIPAILGKYGYDAQSLLSGGARWKLLERPAPELCADRIDYTLRDMYQHGNITIEEVHHFLNRLAVIDGKIVLQDLAAAEWFAGIYYKEVIEFFLHPLNVYGYHLLAKTLKLALAKRQIGRNDLLGTDEEVLDLLRASGDKEIMRLLEQIHRNVKVKEDKSDYDFHWKAKARWIDPAVLYENGPVRASRISERVRRLTEEARKKAEAGVYVKIVSN
jgi:hypothetical protein